MSTLPEFLDEVAREHVATMSNAVGSPAYELAKTELANRAIRLATELRQRLTDEQDAARELNIDPPEPGSPLARAFAANAALRKERDAAYVRGQEAAKKAFLAEIEALRAHLRGEPCGCGQRGTGLNGFHYRSGIGCRYEGP